MTKQEENKKIDEYVNNVYLPKRVKTMQPLLDYLKGLNRVKLIEECLRQWFIAHDNSILLLKVENEYEKRQEKRKQK